MSRFIFRSGAGGLSSRQWHVREQRDPGGAGPGLAAPTYVTHGNDGTGRLFVTEQGGRIRVLVPGHTELSDWLDLSDRVEVGGEAGLVGLAFHPDYADNRQVFATTPSARAVDASVACLG